LKHVLSVLDLVGVSLAGLLDRAEQWRAGLAAFEGRKPPLGALILERPALRTRMAYENAFHHLGGHLTVFEGGVGTSDALADVGRVLSKMVDLVLVRTSSHEMLRALADQSNIPVVNALSDREHPVEVLADALVLRQTFGDLGGRKITFVGDGGNVCASLLLLAPLLSMDAAVSSPEGHGPHPQVLKAVQVLAQARGRRFEIVEDPAVAVEGASAVYTDGWPAFDVDDERERVFGPFRVTRELMERAAPDAIFLHCLPASRGAEVTDEVLDGSRSFAFERLRNLAPTSAALIEILLKEAE